MQGIEVGTIKQSINQSAKYLEARNQRKAISVKDRSVPRIKISALSPLKWLLVYGRSPRGGGGISAYERGGDARRLA